MLFLDFDIEILSPFAFVALSRSHDSDESLSLHVDVLFSRVEVPLLILKLFLEVWLEGAFEIFSQDLLVEFERVLDLGDVFEVDRVGDAEALHFVGVAPLLEVLFEGTPTPVARTSADLALELFSKTVQFEKPVGDRFAVPAHGKVFRIVLYPIFIIVRILCCHLVRQQLLCVHRVFLGLNF